MADEKTCNKCGETKSLDDFGHRKDSTDGRRYKCKVCRSRYNQTNAFQVMVRNSRASDKKAGRTSELEYISVQRISDMNVMQCGRCYYCDTTMVYGKGVNRKTNRDAMTIERVDNNVPHVVENCVLSCYTCNVSRKGKSHEDMVEHGKALRDGTIAYCPGCDMFMLPLMFNRHKDNKTGVQPICRSCQKIHKQTRRQRQRQL